MIEYTVHDVVAKFIGNIYPCGDSSIDAVNLEHMKVHIEVVDKMITDLIAIAQDRKAPEHSIRVAGDIAKDFLDDLKESLETLT